MTRPVLAIIGAGLAGAKAAEGARDAGYDGRILLIGEESTLPYERPPLSKAVLRGEAEPGTARVHDAAIYSALDIELISGQVAEIDTVRRRITFGRDGVEPFDTAVLATGAEPRRLTGPGADLGGVHYLRTIDDAAALAGAIGNAGRVAVVGAGWIGSEVAASARQMGADVVLIDPAPVPLQRVLGNRIGDVFADLHAENGVDLRLGASVRELRGSGSVESVVLDDGRVEAADVVVVGIGVTPRVDVGTTALGLRVDNGIVVDQHLETNVSGIYAAGDVANAWHPHYCRHLRVEHWANALNQGVIAGRNAAGERGVYDRLPYFFSDQYDVGLEYVGLGAPGDDVVIRGDLDGRKFIAFWHRDGIVTAAMNVNVWDVVDDLKGIVGAATTVDLDRLVDESVPLAGVIGTSWTHDDRPPRRS